MPRSFAEEEFDQDFPRRDREITLGPAMLLAIFCGLVLLCGLCFGVGYTEGRRSGQHAITITQSASGQTVTSQAGGSLQKPPAKGTIPSAGYQQAVVPIAQPGASDGTGSANALTSYPPVQSSASSPGSESLVRPALPSQPGAPQTSYAEGAGLMVQIAAVSHVEDANVLMNALKRRGYAVVARREPADNMIHVQIGPFASRADANAMSARLLGDGYNAVVMP
jgi:DedD protein